MTFRDIKNNDALTRRISKQIASGNISHAYIFEGAARRDRIIAADSFAKAILCKVYPGTGCESCIICKKIENGNYEDLIYAEKDENSLKDEVIEEVQKRLKNKPFAGDRSIAVIKDADGMTPRAQNRLLKTLEEPFVGTIIILLSDNIENLAKTIISRCAVLRWNTFCDIEDSPVAEKAEKLVTAMLKALPFYHVKQTVVEFAENRDDAGALLDSMETYAGKYLREGSFNIDAIGKTVRCIEEARQELMRGMNIGQSLKRMMLKMEVI